MTGTGVDPGRNSKNSAIFTKFKYYIHDRPSGYSFEMFGPFTEAVVGELSCCWQTARSAGSKRGLVLDVRNVTYVDERAKQWLAAMSQEGATYLPESFLKDCLAGATTNTTEPKRGWFQAISDTVRACLGKYSDA